MINIFIANLDWEVTSDDLHQTFSTFGAVTYAHVVYDRKTKRSMGFGYVEMEDSDQGINAIQALNGLEVNGRPIDVKVASPKANRAPKKPAAPPKPKPVYKTDGRNSNNASNRPRRPRRDN
jgi:cold-inducible RNA-binding protein